MTVKKDKLIERWTRSGDGWLLLERLGKKEWRERVKAKRDAAKAASKSEAAPDAAPKDSPATPAEAPQ